VGEFEDGLADAVLRGELPIDEALRRLRDADDDRAAALERWIDDLQAGTWVTCVYCGHRYGPRDVAPTSIPEASAPSMREALEQHVASCPRHPMAALKRRLGEVERLARAAAHALRSYQYGNGSAELAAEVAGRIEADLGIENA
jgi:hypothetical protein